MYSLVLMMAMTTPADDVAFGKRGGSCDGYSAAANSCDGGRGGFLGLRNKGGRGGAGCTGGAYGGGCYGGGYAAVSHSCDGGGRDRGGFLARLCGKNRDRGGCHGGGYGNGCCGYNACCAPRSCGCCGVAAAPACCNTHVVATTGCCGSPGMVMPAPLQVAPPVGGGVGAPPVKMPEPPKK